MSSLPYYWQDRESLKRLPASKEFERLLRCSSCSGLVFSSLMTLIPTLGKGGEEATFQTSEKICKSWKLYYSNVYVTHNVATEFLSKGWGCMSHSD
jgi:hypothetical protein